MASIVYSRESSEETAAREGEGGGVTGEELTARDACCKSVANLRNAEEDAEQCF